MESKSECERVAHLPEQAATRSIDEAISRICSARKRHRPCVNSRMQKRSCTQMLRASSSEPLIEHARAARHLPRIELRTPKPSQHTHHCRACDRNNKGANGTVVGACRPTDQDCAERIQDSCTLYK